MRGLSAITPDARAELRAKDARIAELEAALIAANMRIMTLDVPLETAIATEREACAKVAEARANLPQIDCSVPAWEWIAKAIRARGSK
jgi:hypothetical protein